MPLDNAKMAGYTAILREELIPAQGCTEPISLAYASAKAREVLGQMPERIEVASSGNIIKNVKGVVVPGTGGLRGMEIAAVLGAVAGDASLLLEVLRGVTPADIAESRRLVATGACTVRVLKTPAKLHLIVTAYKGEDSALVEIRGTHTGIVRIEHGGEVLLAEAPQKWEATEGEGDGPATSVADIVAYAHEVPLDDIRGILEQQIACNTAIAQEGLQNQYGANVGATLLRAYGSDIKTRARAAAAAGSDARMSGCEMPVVINSGSGNQGLTVSIPVIEYARELRCTDEVRLRSLALSNLVSIHLKRKIGRLSAYCGAVSAAAGAAAGIVFLHGGSLAEIESAITNTLANVSGIVCDGAKPSCAAKIASSIDAAILACTLVVEKRGFEPGEGIVMPGIEETIDSVARMASEGMQITDEVILDIMTAPAGRGKGAV